MGHSERISFSNGGKLDISFLNLKRHDIKFGISARIDDLKEDEISDFQRLLEYEDIEIFDILVNKKSFEDTSLQPIVKKILTFHDLNLGTSS